MNNPNRPDSNSNVASKPEWPWWEPYVFTSFVIVGFIVFMMVCGWIGRVPLMEHLLLGIMTLAALFDFFRRPGELPAVGGKLGSTLFFGFISALYFSDQQWIPGLAYCIMSLIWLILLVLAIKERRRIRLETLRKLDNVIETLRDAKTG